MGTDMSKYMMIYKNQVFNVVSIMPTIDFNDGSIGIKKAKMIEAATISENGELVMINDEASMFKFVRR